MDDIFRIQKNEDRIDSLVKRFHEFEKEVASTNKVTESLKEVVDLINLMNVNNRERDERVKLSLELIQNVEERVENLEYIRKQQPETY